MVDWSGVWYLLGPCGHGGPFASAQGWIGRVGEWADGCRCVLLVQ